MRNRCRNSRQSKPSQHHHREDPEVYRLEGGLLSIWQLNTAFVIPFSLSTTGIISNKLHDSLKLLNRRPAIYIVIQKAVIINIFCMVRNVLVEQWIRRVCSVRPLLFGNKLNHYEVRKGDDNNVITIVFDSFIGSDVTYSILFFLMF